MRTLCEDLKENVLEVVRLWEEAHAEDPWVLLPEEERVDHLPAVIDAIADAVLCQPPNRDDLRRLVDEASVHGHHRRDLGVPDSVILTEFDLLRRALWRYLRERYAVGGKGVQGILLIDSALALATRASMLGYHQPQLEAQGRWPGAIERLLEDAPIAWVG